MEKGKGFESKGRLAGKKGWNKDVGVGRMGNRGGELTVEESSSSSISSLMRDAVVSSGSTELSSVFMMIMTGWQLNEDYEAFSKLMNLKRDLPIRECCSLGL